MPDETQSEIAAAIDTITDAVKAGRGRPRGTRNKSDHKAGRPLGCKDKAPRKRKPPEEFHPSIWEGGRAYISVEQRHIDEAMRANSSHCAIALAIRDAVGDDCHHIAVDLQTCRFSSKKRGVRYVFLTPAIAQHSIIIPFDQGEECKPVSFSMKPAFVCKSGAKRRHTPDPKQLRGTGLKVAEEQPHIPPESPLDAPASDTEKDMAQNWKPKSGAADGALIAPLDNPELAREPNPPLPSRRKPRTPRAKISATRPDGSIPVTLGGKLPPVSVLARREFGLRALKR
jgi:hypothetical protein